MLKKVDLVIALNKYVKESVLAAHKTMNIKIIPNAIDLKSYNKIKTTNKSNPVKFIFLGSYMQPDSS